MSQQVSIHSTPGASNFAELSPIKQLAAIMAASAPPCADQRFTDEIVRWLDGARLPRKPRRPRKLRRARKQPETPRVKAFHEACAAVSKNLRCPSPAEQWASQWQAMLSPPWRAPKPARRAPKPARRAPKAPSVRVRPQRPKQRARSRRAVRRVTRQVAARAAGARASDPPGPPRSRVCGAWGVVARAVIGGAS